MKLLVYFLSSDLNAQALACQYKPTSILILCCEPSLEHCLHCKQFSLDYQRKKT